MKILGIDEAGRGPVIGPLVVCGVVVEEDKIKNMERLGIRDSKKIAPKKRNVLARKIKKIAEYHLVKISAREIDVLRSKNLTLNEIERIAIVKIIDTLVPDLAIIDSVDVNPERLKNEIEGILDGKVEVIAEHGADDSYTIVGAASIVAKVERDFEIEKIKRKYGDVGSGYPSDPKTIKFLKKFQDDDFPEFVRRSWATIKRIKEDTNGI
ncbi:MAG: ribonuclease HII [Euryarchaeota archaeon]|nr:ribonuclease HII [Euryarchaeota archaeon]